MYRLVAPGASVSVLPQPTLPQKAVFGLDSGMGMPVLVPLALEEAGFK